MAASTAMRRGLVTAGLLLPALLFIALWFVLPLAELLALSLSDKRGTFAAYSELIEGEVYRRVFLNTLLVAVGVTGVCLFFAYPTAYVLTRLKGAWLFVAFWCVLFPFWVSVLVRTFSWMLLLEKNGPVNRLLQLLLASEAPLPLLFNQAAVFIGMAHVLLPYAVLPIYASMVRIDGRLLLASDGLGASPLTTFTRIYLPLSLPGVGAAAALVFLLALGFFITPALLGGISSLTLAMLIEQLVNERLVWPLAAAASFLLLAATLILIAAASRLLPFGQAVAAK
jgi:putative spermidine/putrescine transport system permease protein